MQMPHTPGSEGPWTGQSDLFIQTPIFDDDESLIVIVHELSSYFVDLIQAPHTFEQLRTAVHPGIVSALLMLRWHYSNIEHDDRGVWETRGFACEIVAKNAAGNDVHIMFMYGLANSESIQWRFLTYLSEKEAIDYLLHELPATKGALAHTPNTEEANELEHGMSPNDDQEDERASLLWNQPSSHDRPSLQQLESDRRKQKPDLSDEDPTKPFVGLNALEIAAIANAKKFLSQRVVQKIVNDIWSGHIVFWESLSVRSRKKAQVYNQRRADPYSRLRVPKYQKVFEALFFAVFLALYYAVLVERNPYHITPVEVMLYIWIAAFACEEFGEFRDAGTLFYAADFWSLWDVIIIAIGAAFLVARIVGLSKDSDRIIDVSFDILSLEAIFLVPRVCSLLSLVPYFGSLIPCLKAMTKDFVNFLGIVTILFIGFLTTFTMLARDTFTVTEIWWTMIYVFFGSSYLGFSLADFIAHTPVEWQMAMLIGQWQISKTLGSTLMLCFVVLTNILLLTSLIAILSNSLTKVMDHAREEYLYQYSVFVLEASASRRLTYYFPPLNLIPLILFRPLRLCVPADQIRSARIFLLKATHWPYVAAIYAYEHAGGQLVESVADWRHNSQSKLTVRHRPLPGNKRLQRTLRYPGLGNRSEISLPAKNPMGEGHGTATDNSELMVELSEVKKMIGKLNMQEKMEQKLDVQQRLIEKLSRQVDELNQRLAKPDSEDEH
ncbi:hypothetical protein G7Y79_00022g051640 [Physcia stellaris]|nr:hypothetical protein G7Y79_00022g051640 [Physcia stellaris]